MLHRRFGNHDSANHWERNVDVIRVRRNGHRTVDELQLGQNLLDGRATKNCPRVRRRVWASPCLGEVFAMDVIRRWAQKKNRITGVALRLAVAFDVFADAVNGEATRASQ